MLIVERCVSALVCNSLKIGVEVAVCHMYLFWFRVVKVYYHIVVFINFISENQFIITTVFQWEIRLPKL